MAKNRKFAFDRSR